jgi:CMP-N,N'-diacetyllegionaminic acid synthase
VNVLGVIPARGGSKRVPRKNLRLLCGKPLIEWTINAAKASKLTKWVVSTEDYEIGRVAADLGSHVIRRPDVLAQDETSSGDVLAHALEWCGSEDFGLAICLHPTSPIRDPEHINQAIDLLQTFDSVASVREIPRKAHPNVKVMVDGALCTLTDSPVYVLNASIYGMSRERLLRTRSHAADVSAPIVMDDAHSVDIDEEQDFAIAEAYMRLMGRASNALNSDGKT